MAIVPGAHRGESAGRTSLPGVFLAVGSLLLPPSRDSSLVRAVELMEMRVEATLTERAFELDSVQSGHSIEKDGLLVRELKDYKRLFLPAYRDRTMIGILIMYVCTRASLARLELIGLPMYVGLALPGQLAFTSDGCMDSRWLHLHFHRCVWHLVRTRSLGAPERSLSTAMRRKSSSVDYTDADGSIAGVSPPSIALIDAHVAIIIDAPWILAALPGHTRLPDIHPAHEDVPPFLLNGRASSIHLVDACETSEQCMAMERKTAKKKASAAAKKTDSIKIKLPAAVRRRPNPRYKVFSHHVVPECPRFLRLVANGHRCRFTVHNEAQTLLDVEGGERREQYGSTGTSKSFCTLSLSIARALPYQENQTRSSRNASNTTYPLRHGYQTTRYHCTGVLGGFLVAADTHLAGWRGLAGWPYGGLHADTAVGQLRLIAGSA
ncbi:hypothetical protein IMY05_C4513000200 [Salix suchowensis]|nr:hypothetical protein IMY05_C4513000200 [Salix suchowensis]